MNDKDKKTLINIDAERGELEITVVEMPVKQIFTKHLVRKTPERRCKKTRMTMKHEEDRRKVNTAVDW
jgi:hypothetical protein